MTQDLSVTVIVLPRRRSESPSRVSESLGVGEQHPVACKALNMWMFASLLHLSQAGLSCFHVRAVFVITVVIG
jgi:hypothetical protein